MCENTDRIHHCPWSVQSREKINAVVVGEDRHIERDKHRNVFVCEWSRGERQQNGTRRRTLGSCSPVVRAVPTLYHKPNADHFQSPSNWLSHLQIDWELGERDKRKLHRIAFARRKDESSCHEVVHDRRRDRFDDRFCGRSHYRWVYHPSRNQRDWSASLISESSCAPRRGNCRGFSSEIFAFREARQHDFEACTLGMIITR